MGRAEELFFRIRAKGAGEIHSMIGAQFVEELFLDYKRSATTLPSRRLADDDRKNLAKAIGGFANSEGGVTIWGVDCRQTTSGDIPTSAVLITDPVALKTLFDNAIGGLTLPAHSGVENIALADASGSGGFVVTHVPPGLNVPYRTLYPKEEYYIRAGSNFVPTPHGVLAGLFGRAPQPNVAPIVRPRNVQIVQGVPPQVRVNLQVGIINRGRGFAEDIFGVVDMDANLKIVVSFPFDKDKYIGWRTTNETRNCFTIMLHGLVLPPGVEQHGFEIAVDIPGPDAGPVILAISCGSRGGPGSTVNIEFPARLLSDVYNQYTFAHRDVASMRAAQSRADDQIRSRL